MTVGKISPTEKDKYLRSQLHAESKKAEVPGAVDWRLPGAGERQKWLKVVSGDNFPAWRRSSW